MILTIDCYNYLLIQNQIQLGSGMKSLMDQLTEKFFNAIQSAYSSLSASPQLVEVTKSTNEKFGHYQCNSAMKLAKELKISPRQVAETIVHHLPIDGSLIEKLEIAGPGFINITLRTAALEENLNQMLKDKRLGIPKPRRQQRIVIDFSSPNVAKEMHVGHLRSTIIGDCLARLFEFLGEDVLRLNHIGDWGTAFGMLIAYIRENAPDVLTGHRETDSSTLVEWYKASKKRFDEDPEFKKRSQQEVVALQQGETISRKAWSIICQISRKSYQEIYDLLEVHLVERGESYYNSLLGQIIKLLDAKKLTTISDGAKCVFLEGFHNREGEPLPLIVQKSDGGYNYATTDLATIRQRVESEKADRVIYVTDMGQAQHFEMVFQTAEKAGWLDRKKIRIDHVPFGLVLGPDGKKFKTRSGDTEKLIDLLTTAIERAKQILRERDFSCTDVELEELAKKIGISAVKYADLSCNRTGDYQFSYDRMLRFEGNTAAFLLYAYVRINGIKRKVNCDMDHLLKTERIHLQHPSELALGVQLRQFHETLLKTAEDLLPNRLTDYLYELAEKFNAFFRDCRVEGTPEQNSRLLLCELTARVLNQGLSILGLHTVERM